MTMITRRTLLRGTAGTLAGSLAGTMLARSTHGAVVEFQELPTANDDRFRMLISTAVDAAKSVGASYSDARLTFTQQMTVFGQDISDSVRRVMYPVNRFETMSFGVRAQVDGYWGFASSPVWTKEEAARLGRAAVDSAKANVSSQPRSVEMAPNPKVTSGNWVMPVIDDPFEMDSSEIFDYLSGIQKYMFTMENEIALGAIMYFNLRTDFSRQQKAFGSSDGQLVTQRLYRTAGNLGWTVGDRSVGGAGVAGGTIPYINGAGAGQGFEYLRSPHMREWCRKLYEELEEERRLPMLPVDVGRYPVLIHPSGVAPILKKSVGVATEIDRVMGYEANTTGTSYIVDPEESLGTLKIGVPMMHVTATRSMPSGLAQVKWDDEGVAPPDFDIIKQGILTDLQRNREGTAWMKGYLTKMGQPLQSNGCAYANDADDPQTIHPSDLILHPTQEGDTTLTQLREQIDKGLEFKDSGTSMDYQQSTGMLTGMGFLIKNGKRVARVTGGGMLFRTSELWGNLRALGGPSSVMTVGTMDAKSSASWKFAYSSVSTPPALFKDMSIIDPSRKA